MGLDHDKIAELDIDEILDKESVVKDLMEKFDLTPKQALSAFHIACGDNPHEAVDKAYSFKYEGGPYNEATKLLNLYKFREALDYLSNDTFIDEKISGLKLRLLYWGLKRLQGEKHSPSAVGVWKTLMALGFEEKLPDAGKKVSENLNKLIEHFKESEEAKLKVAERVREVVEEERVDNLNLTGKIEIEDRSKH